MEANQLQKPNQGEELREFRYSIREEHVNRIYFWQHIKGTWVDAPQLEYLGNGRCGNRPMADASEYGQANHVWVPAEFPLGYFIGRLQIGEQRRLDTCHGANKGEKGLRKETCGYDAFF